MVRAREGLLAWARTTRLLSMRLKGTSEGMNAKKKSRKVTSPEAPTSSHRRGAIGWLERVAAESPHPTARRAAKEDVTSWDGSFGRDS